MSYARADNDKPSSSDPKVDFNTSGASQVSSTKSTYQASPDISSNSSSLKRHYSSMSFVKQSMLSCTGIKISDLDHKTKHFHTSSSHFSLTSEELAKLAKLKQLRKSKNTSGPINKTQTLNPESRERKVPSSRVGRLGSFGSKSFFY